MEVKILNLDYLCRICGYFKFDTSVNNGYGCKHADCRESSIVKIKQDGFGYFEYDDIVDEPGSVRSVLYRKYGVYNVTDLLVLKKDKIFRRYFDKLEKNEHDEGFLKTVGFKKIGCCYSFSCPVAYEADKEDLKEYDNYLYEEWKDKEEEPSHYGAELMVVQFDEKGEVVEWKQS